MYVVNSYLLILFLCLVVSIYQKTARQRFLWVYFIIVFGVEFTKIKTLKNSSSVIYTYFSISYILFFFYYYLNQKVNKYVLSLITLVSVSIYLFVLFDNNIVDYPIIIGMIMSLTYIFFTLQWFLYQLVNVDDVRILNKQAFWVSSSLIIWAVVFLFRFTPMYWLEINDKQFLRQISFGYQIATIFSYCLFLKGLFCKR